MIISTWEAHAAKTHLSRSCLALPMTMIIDLHRLHFIVNAIHSLGMTDKGAFLQHTAHNFFFFFYSSCNENFKTISIICRGCNNAI